MNRSYKIIFYKKLPSDLKVQFERLIREFFIWHQSGKEKQVEYDAMIAPVNSQPKFQAVLSDKKPFDIGRGNW